MNCIPYPHSTPHTHSLHQVLHIVGIHSHRRTQPGGLGSSFPSPAARLSHHIQHSTVFEPPPGHTAIFDPRSSTLVSPLPAYTPPPSLRAALEPRPMCITFNIQPSLSHLPATPLSSTRYLRPSCHHYRRTRHPQAYELHLSKPESDYADKPESDYADKPESDYADKPESDNNNSSTHNNNNNNNNGNHNGHRAG